jgi:transposase
MQGRKQTKSRLFYQIDLERFLPSDHFLRKLESCLSLEWLREKTKSYYSHTGKPSVDPVVLIKMLLIGYLYDIRSERRLVEEISLNLAYRWYTGYDLDEEVPNHSIFSKARKRFGKKLFLQVFEEILKECVKAGLVKADSLFIDSTLIKANASMDSLMEVNLAPEKYWRKLEEEEKPRSPRGRKPIDNEASQVGVHFKGEIDEEKMGRRRRDRNPSYLKKRSKTDPDATLHFRPGLGPSLSYKAHLAADTSGIITSVAVSPSAEHDVVKLPRLLGQHKKYLKIPEFLAGDSSYGTEEALGYLQSQGIKTVIALIGTRNRPNHFKKELFIYDKENDCYLCPDKKMLKRRAKNSKTNQIHYRASPQDCQACSWKQKCIGEKTSSRIVTRYDSDYAEKARIWYHSDEGKMLSRLRKIVIEGLFGQAKTFHGLSRAKLRGLENVEIQALLTATALNLKKLVKETYDFVYRFFIRLAKAYVFCP